MTKSEAEREPLTSEMVEMDSTHPNPIANPSKPHVSNVKWTPFMTAAFFFLVIMNWPGEMQFEGKPIPAAKRCLAILVSVSTLWATEAIPLYVTSLLIPVLTVGSGALLPLAGKCKQGDTECIAAQYSPLSPSAAAREICGQFFDPTVLLFMAGFSIGAVMEKQRLSNMIASILLRPFGNKPENVLLGIMSLGTFLSMWISNVPSSVLCVSLAQPIIHQLPNRDPYAKALLIGIAISNNIGGMTTPIASPQNVIAFNWCSVTGNPVSFMGWLCLTIPYCGILLLAAWYIIRFRYPPQLRTLQISELTREQPRMNPSQVLALGVTTCTVVAWAFWKPLDLEPIFGSMGLLGIIPIAIFFSSGLLDRNDFHNGLNWSVLVLIGGGLALGHVMERSYLLHIMSSTIQESLSGANLWTFTTAFSSFMAIIANFVSSTVAAIIILPVVANVGKSIGQANVMIIASVFMDSAAMALPVSSFPNTNSFAVLRRGPVPTIEDGEDENSKDGSNKSAGNGSVLEVQDYVITGGLVTLVAQLEVSTIGFLLLRGIVGR
ncbi:hypothetical protein GUITHDRAFT_86445 [Guillardia theta CCMP2712]|uniref:Citrate transporter-like domain-containing protein n=1 Tax=Guillardia theta (strain CCMP2712) TaxID=905079 RepID=L1JF38_GUITC|nr:hypothetical protein GUITHDRAFT_86445 [Guillardia theta CCMP2712]EKX47116.1 hypothetical protein GUITHDRAFT_86445 [Guillardia theta CCMP2712]|eukprot:XP_005834096.1 hypothetical protein GUITHDRAFT_86445 [Guillardia theta CCMP2712]